jgi:NADH-quinone oxidoreductase subunit B
VIVAGRVSQKMAPVLPQACDQMAGPRWVISMGVCAFSGGMFSNYANVQGLITSSRWTSTLPGCPPRPGMLLDAMLKFHDKSRNSKLGASRDKQVNDLEQAQLRRLPLAVRRR